jgi:hypothetical protein
LGWRLSQSAIAHIERVRHWAGRATLQYDKKATDARPVVRLVPLDASDYASI